MMPLWARVTQRGAEIGVVVCLVLVGVVVLRDSLRLGPGWGDSGPQPGFFPFVLTVTMLLGVLGVIYFNILRYPNRYRFFEVAEEVEDLLKVGLPIVVAIALVRWLGLYLTSGLYLAFFMAWYGRFRWYQALAGGIVLPILLWLVLRQAFNISMPMTVFYRMGILPF